MTGGINIPPAIFIAPIRPKQTTLTISQVSKIHTVLNSDPEKESKAEPGLWNGPRYKAEANSRRYGA